jgi:hypothetical protein
LRSEVPSRQTRVSGDLGGVTERRSRSIRVLRTQHAAQHEQRLAHDLRLVGGPGGIDRPPAAPLRLLELSSIEGDLRGDRIDPSQQRRVDAGPRRVGDAACFLDGDTGRGVVAGGRGRSHDCDEQVGLSHRLDLCSSKVLGEHATERKRLA